MTSRWILAIVIVSVLTACVAFLTYTLAEQPANETPGPQPLQLPGSSKDWSHVAASLEEERQKHPTRLTRQLSDAVPPEDPPAGVLDLVHYPAQPGPLAAYLTPDPGDGGKHPAVIWLRGGNCNSIGDVWRSEPFENDRTGLAFRLAGLVVLYPSLRGGNDNPGHIERLFGEVDDVIAAAAFLAKQPWVDPKRIYLVGHDTGATLALLTAETVNPFQAVFCLGPTNGLPDPADGPCPFDVCDPTEVRLRNPANWLASIQTPTFVLEGDTQPARTAAFKAIQDQGRNFKALSCVSVHGRTHLSLVGRANELIANLIRNDLMRWTFTDAFEFKSLSVPQKPNTPSAPRRTR